MYVLHCVPRCNTCDPGGCSTRQNRRRGDSAQHRTLPALPLPTVAVPSRALPPPPAMTLSCPADCWCSTMPITMSCPDVLRETVTNDFGVCTPVASDLAQLPARLSQLSSVIKVNDWTAPLNAVRWSHEAPYHTNAPQGASPANWIWCRGRLRVLSRSFRTNVSNIQRFRPKS